MAGDKQIQKAGDNSQQFQANTIIVNQGIDEKRAREICTETFEIAKRDFTQEAMACATERVQQLENRLISRMLPIEGAISSFADPAFQVLLTNAQRTAVASEREADYDMLAELLVCHIEKGVARKTRTGISKAVEIVDKIDDDALCALTIMYSITTFFPVTTLCKQGIYVLSNLFNKLEYMDLPSGSDWIEHLEILNTLRVNTISHFRRFEDYLPEKLPYYNHIGIKKESEDYKKALTLLSSVSLNNESLVTNDLMPDYVKFSFNQTENFDDVTLTHTVRIGNDNVQVKLPITDDHKKVFNEVFMLYDKSDNTRKEYKRLFIEEWNKYKSLSIIQKWWNELPFSFDITHIGKVLAYTNAKRCDKDLPDLPLNL